MRRCSGWIGLALMLVMAAPQADDVPVVISVKRLTADFAMRAAVATLAACRERGVSVAVAIVDRSGVLQVLLRDTLAMPLTVPVAQGKARAAANFNAPTSEMAARDIASELRTAGGILMLPGGLPITAAGAILGGIGVSGAPSGEMDEACAADGLKAILDDLEMVE
jgi:uncharacterized protein GlcG (DUF336 family)